MIVLRLHFNRTKVVLLLCYDCTKTIYAKITLWLYQDFHKNIRYFLKCTKIVFSWSRAIPLSPPISTGKNSEWKPLRNGSIDGWVTFSILTTNIILLQVQYSPLYCNRFMSLMIFIRLCTLLKINLGGFNIYLDFLNFVWTIHSVPYISFVLQCNLSEYSTTSMERFKMWALYISC